MLKYDTKPKKMKMAAKVKRAAVKTLVNAYLSLVCSMIGMTTPIPSKE